MLGKEITKENLKAASLKIFTGKWALRKGFDKVKLVTPLQEIRNYNNIRDLQI